MREKRIMAVIMSLFMMFSLLPSTVFAAQVSTLDGQLKIKGNAVVGTTLSADLTGVKPEELAEDSVSYVWSRKDLNDTENKNLKEISKEKTYSITQEDLGFKVVLMITGLEDKGITGSLKAETVEVTETVPVVQSQTEQEQTAEADQEILQEVPLVQEIESDSESNNQEQEIEEAKLSEDEILVPVDPSEMEEAGSESVDGIPPAQEDGTDLSESFPNDPADSGDSENTEESAGNNQEVNSATAVAENGTNILDFGSITVSQAAETSLSITIKNTGTTRLDFDQINEVTSPHFAVDDIAFLEPGQEATVLVWPRQGLETGTYNDTISYTVQRDGVLVASASFTVKMVLTEDEVPEVPVQGLESDKEFMEFTASEPQTISITNISDAETVIQVTTGAGYVIADPDLFAIPAGETKEFTIKPAENLNKEETYADTLNFTDTANAENSVSVPVTVTLPEDIPEPVSDMTAETDVADFGTVVEGYQDAPAEKSVKLMNNGTGAAELSDPVSENGESRYFDTLLTDKNIAAGGNTHLIIRPKTGLVTGVYSESFTITEQTTGKAIVIHASFSVETAKHSLSVSPETLEFASVKKGYGQIEAQQITVTNNGNVIEILTQPVGTNFEVSQVDAAALTVQPGASVSFTVKPKNGLDTGSYKESIRIASQSAETAVTTMFQVVKGTATINKIETPKDITGLANGTKKDAKSLGLPSTIVIGTTAGNMNASVTWDVKNCNYDPSGTQEQTFSIKGAVTLPEGVDNDNNLTLATNIRVNVKAYAPKTVSADNNKITGIEYNGVYTTQSRISFTAVGAGMDNTSPRKGDTRYLPVNWTVINTNNWNAAPYTASFGMAQSGDYTLKVTFQLQTYDGSSWKNSEKYDAKKVPFTISKAKVTGPGQNLTSQGNRRNAVRTGDRTPILPLVIILIAASAVAGVIIYRKRK